MIQIERVLSRLALRRPLFCSEADFQHELAYELRLENPELGVRLEYPLEHGMRGAIDILLIGQQRYALELKYLCKGLSTQIGNEPMLLRQQGAHDIRRYDVCKDIARMERYAERTGHGAGVLVLTNDPAYWQPRRRAGTVDAAFDLADTRQVAGVLEWSALAGPGTVKKREAPIELLGSYPLAWRDYSNVECSNGKFRYLWVPVASARG